MNRGEATKGLQRLDVAYGYSVINANRALFQFPNEDRADPPSRHRRHGLALHAAWDKTPKDPHEHFPLPFADGMHPWVSAGIAADWASISAGGQGREFHTSGEGFELICGNVVGVRVGHLRDKVGDIDGVTWGYMVGLPLYGLCGIRYDEAHVPQSQASGLDPQTRREFSAWVDPGAVIVAFGMWIVHAMGG
jgi:hypothetical protein